MNKELMGREFNLPENIIQHLATKLSQYSSDTDGTMRTKNLLQTKKVNYNQLKRILHDMKYMDKTNESVKYELYGGELMEKWGSQILHLERGQISDRKDSRQQADNIGAINGMRKNSHLSTHKKKDSYKSPINTMKSNSEKTSVSSLSLSKLFEELTKSKKLKK